jgi:hypothetical protein
MGRKMGSKEAAHPRGLGRWLGYNVEVTVEA